MLYLFLIVKNTTKRCVMHYILFYHIFKQSKRFKTYSKYIFYSVCCNTNRTSILLFKNHNCFVIESEKIPLIIFYIAMFWLMGKLYIFFFVEKWHKLGKNTFLFRLQNKNYIARESLLHALLKLKVYYI